MMPDDPHDEAMMAWLKADALMSELGIKWYILDGETVKAVGIKEHCLFFQRMDQPWRIGSTYVDDIWISTVLLKCVTTWPERETMHFETMVFPDNESMQYATVAEARAGHAEMVATVREAQLKAGMPGRLMDGP